MIEVGDLVENIYGAKEKWIVKEYLNERYIYTERLEKRKYTNNINEYQLFELKLVEKNYTKRINRLRKLKEIGIY